MTQRDLNNYIIVHSIGRSTLVPIPVLYTRFIIYSTNVNPAYTIDSTTHDQARSREI